MKKIQAKNAKINDGFEVAGGGQLAALPGEGGAALRQCAPDLDGDEIVPPEGGGIPRNPNRNPAQRLRFGEEEQRNE